MNILKDYVTTEERLRNFSWPPKKELRIKKIKISIKKSSVLDKAVLENISDTTKHTTCGVIEYGE